MFSNQELSARNRYRPWFASALDAAGLCVLGACFLLFLCNAAKGLDITDRSYYLLWAIQPENVTGSITHFGFITSLIYEMAGQNIVFFRISGLVILLALAFGFALCLGKYLKNHLPEISRDFSFAALVLCVLTGTLFYYQAWLHEPSYNWLALAGSLLTMSGLCLFRGPQASAAFPLAAVTAVACGGVLAFIAKPTTALVLVCIVCLWVAYSGFNRQGLKLILGSAGLSILLLAVFAWIFFGSIHSYVNNLKFGYELGSILGGGHTLENAVVSSATQIWNFLVWWIKTPYAQATALVAILATVCSFFRAGAQIKAGLRRLFPAIILICFLHLIYRFYLGEASLYISTILLTVLGLGFIFAAHYFVGAAADSSRDGRFASISRTILPVMFLVSASLAPAFGTSSNVVRRMSEYPVFIAAAILITLSCIAPDRFRRISCSAFGFILSGLLLLTVLNAYERPYRLPGTIKEQTVAVDFADSGKLYLDQKTADYAAQLRQTAMEAGWTEGTPLIDITGGSPGALVILESRILGTPWILGNYPGSQEFARKVLESVDREILDKAWILSAPEGKRKISEEVLLENRLVFPDEYEQVGSFRTGHRLEKQFLWRPMREDGINHEGR